MTEKIQATHSDAQWLIYEDQAINLRQIVAIRPDYEDGEIRFQNSGGATVYVKTKNVAESWKAIKNILGSDW